MEPEPMAYVALAPCGCIKLATVDTPKRKDTNAREIAACLKAGYRIERVTCEWVRANFVISCAVCKPAKRQPAPVEQEVLGI